MKKYVLLICIAAFSLTLSAQDKYAVIISEQFAYDNAQAIDKHWIKTLDEWHNMVFKDNIPIDNVYVFFCNGIDYQHPGMPDKYNPEMFCMCHITNYPAKKENIKIFFQGIDKNDYYTYDYPKLNMMDSIFVSIITFEKSSTIDSIEMFREAPVSISDLQGIIGNVNANVKIEIK